MNVISFVDMSRHFLHLWSEEPRSPCCRCLLTENKGRWPTVSYVGKDVQSSATSFKHNPKEFSEKPILNLRKGVNNNFNVWSVFLQIEACSFSSYLGKCCNSRFLSFFFLFLSAYMWASVMSVHLLDKLFPLNLLSLFIQNKKKFQFIAGIPLFKLDYSAKYIKGSARVHLGTTDWGSNVALEECIFWQRPGCTQTTRRRIQKPMMMSRFWMGFEKDNTQHMVMYFLPRPACSN